MTTFDSTDQMYAPEAGKSDILTKNVEKSLKNRHFRHMGVTHPLEVWNFAIKIPIHATNFPHLGVWDDKKYVWYSRLSETPVYVGDPTVLKTDPQNVHHRLVKKGSKTRQNDEVWTSFLLDFHDFWSKSPILRPRGIGSGKTRQNWSFSGKIGQNDQIWGI